MTLHEVCEYSLGVTGLRVAIEYVCGNSVAVEDHGFVFTPCFSICLDLLISKVNFVPLTKVFFSFYLYYRELNGRKLIVSIIIVSWHPFFSSVPHRILKIYMGVRGFPI